MIDLQKLMENVQKKSYMKGITLGGVLNSKYNWLEERDQINGTRKS